MSGVDCCTGIWLMVFVASLRYESNGDVTPTNAAVHTAGLAVFDPNGNVHLHGSNPDCYDLISSIVKSTLLSRRNLARSAIVGQFVFVLATVCNAQLNWEGQTGGLLTPFAYTSASSARGFGPPEVAFHYMNAGPVLGNEFQASITVGFLKVGEIGFTRSFNAQGSTPELSPDFANGFNISHIKFRLVPENAHRTKFVPAIAAGAVVRTQVRRVTEVPERENTTCTDFDLIATKTIDELRGLPIVLNLGVKVTNSSLMGIAANSPNWTVRTFGAAALEVKGPKHSKLLLGIEFAQQPRQLKEVPGPFFPTTATIPTTLAYFARVRTGRDSPVNLDFGVVQLAGRVGPVLDLQARHQFTMGVSYRF